MRKHYCFVADRSGKMSDDETLVIAQIPVNCQLGLPGNLSGGSTVRVHLLCDGKKNKCILILERLIATVDNEMFCLRLSFPNELRALSKKTLL